MNTTEPTIQQQQPIHSNTSPSEPIIPSATQIDLKNNNAKVILISVIIVLLLGVVAVAAFFLGVSQSSNAPSLVPPNGEVGCTMEAKICPDGSAVGRSGPNCEFAECPATPATTNSGEQSSVSSYTLAEDLTQIDSYGDALIYTQADILLTLPVGSLIYGELEITKGNQNIGKIVKVNDVEYQIEVNRMAGPCGMGEDNSECGYTEESIDGADTIKIWKDQRGVFAVNFIGITIDSSKVESEYVSKTEGYYLDSIYISKVNQSAFSQAEIELWKTIFATIHPVLTPREE